LKIAIIDNWISQEALQQVCNRQIQAYHVLDGKVNPQVETSAIRSHGTICGSILTETLLQQAELQTISTANGEKPMEIDNVCAALEWCCESPPDFLCMSLGTTNWLETSKFGKLTKRLQNAGTQIFAACANNGHIAFPAAYPWVTGIQYEPTVSGFYQEENSLVGCNIVVGDFTTSVLENLSKTDDFFKCRTNSMAAPYALGRMISEKLALADLPLWTSQQSTHEIDELPMPAVALRGSSGRMEALLALLQKECYQAALLTDRGQTDWERMVLQITPDDFLKWIKPLEEAGILLLDMEGELVSARKYADCELDLNSIDTQTAYAKILQFFETGDGEYDKA